MPHPNHGPPPLARPPPRAPVTRPTHPRANSLHSLCNRSNRTKPSLVCESSKAPLPRALISRTIAPLSPHPRATLVRIAGATPRCATRTSLAPRSRPRNARALVSLTHPKTRRPPLPHARRAACVVAGVTTHPSRRVDRDAIVGPRREESQGLATRRARERIWMCSILHTRSARCGFGARVIVEGLAVARRRDAPQTLSAAPRGGGRSTHARA